MSKRFTLLVAAAGAVACTAALALAGGASGASSLPTLKIALTGVKGISISSNTIPSGAVNVTSTFSGKLPRSAQGASAGIIRLHPGVTIEEAGAAVDSHHGDLDALTPYGTLLVNMAAPSAVQTVLTPGNYVALNGSGNGQPAFAPFTVSQSSAPAALPKAKATETAMEFAFKGPRVLHDGTIVRAQNHGYLVHMIILEGVRSKRAGRKLMKLMRAGAPQRKARPYLNGSFAAPLLPVSPGGFQQAVLHAKPGYYVESCFMDVQDHRDHAQLGMARLVRVVK